MLPRVKRTGTSSLALALSRSEFLPSELHLVNREGARTPVVNGLIYE